MDEIKIGVYTLGNELFGFKTDTCWSLSSNEKHSKLTYLEKGEIRKPLLENLVFFLKLRNERKLENDELLKYAKDGSLIVKAHPSELNNQKELAKYRVFLKDNNTFGYEKI
ncbi:MAG: hypothetical protein NUV46_00045 [Nanoarchaeota archaeon]|nr:hypothetical protein [Nanoarchaeota archaeon]